MGEVPENLALTSMRTQMPPAKSPTAEGGTDQLIQALPGWSLAPLVDSLVALRAIDRLAATVLLAELGDINRFDFGQKSWQNYLHVF